MPGQEPIALTILTGFLGAGKTTLLNRLLKDPELADTAVIINEFGEIALDHLLVEQSSDGIIELGGGCLCCTVRGELVETLLTLCERPQRLKRVIVETTGLADPVPVLQAAMAHPSLSRAYRLEGVVAVIDAVNGADTLATYGEARSQVAVADRIVVTKADLAPEGVGQTLFHSLAGLNAEAEIVDARSPVAGSGILLQADAGWPADLAGAMSAHLHDHHHDDGDNDHHHETQFSSVSLSHDRPIPKAAIENFLDLLATQQGDAVLRIKGLVETAEHPDRPLLVQGAQKLLHTSEILAGWPGGERGTRIIVIGRALDTDYVRRIFAAFTSQPAIDTPDRAAVEDNPLAISGFRI